MMIHEITAVVGRDKKRKRIGRGRGSGTGKTSGRGHKGGKSRSGFSAKSAFEGGQMPYFRRIPKRGFTNVNFTTSFRIVNLRSIVAHPNFAKGGEVTADTLVGAGLVPKSDEPIKILGDMGEGQTLGVALKATVARVTANARKQIEDAGGSVSEVGTRRDRVRGIDRASGSDEPTKLTKKLKRYRARKKKASEG